MNRPEDIQEQLSAYVDGQLGEEEARQVEQAVGADESLARDLAAIRATRDVLRAERALSPPPDFVDRVLAEARRRNLIPASQQAAQAPALAAAPATPPAAVPHAPRRWVASWPVRLAAAASLVLAVAAGGTVAVLYWTNYPTAAPTAAVTADARKAPLAATEAEAPQPVGKLALEEDRLGKADGGWAYSEKDAANRQVAAKPAVEAPASARLRSSLAEAKDGLKRKGDGKDEYYYANAKAIVRDLAGESRTAGRAAHRGAADKNSLGDELANAENEAPGEAVQKLDLHVTHLAAARREVAAILTSAASPAATDEVARGKVRAGDVTVAKGRGARAEETNGAVRLGAAKPAAGGTGGLTLAPTADQAAPAAATTPTPAAPRATPEPAAAPAAAPALVAVAPPRPASPPAATPAPVIVARAETPAKGAGLTGNGAGFGVGAGNRGGPGGPAAGPASSAALSGGTIAATIADQRPSPIAADRIGQADQAGKFQPAAPGGQRASALESLRGMACDGSAGTGVWKFVIVDTPERIERISQAVRRVGVLDKDAESGQRLCVAEQTKGVVQTQFAGRMPQSQSQSAPYHVAEIQRRPETRPAEPLRLLIITLRAESATPASNANPDRNLAK